MSTEELNEIRKENSSYFRSLQFGQEQGILSESEMLAKSTLKKEQIITEHEKRHKISQGPDGRWRTYLPNGTPKGKLIAKKKREDLNAAIVAFYTEQQEETKQSTFRALYPQYIHQKRYLEKLADTSIAKYQASWNFLLNHQAEIVDYDVKKLSRGQYRTWAMGFLSNNPMNKKSFDDLRTVLNGIITYAADHDIINDVSAASFTLPQSCYLQETAEDMNDEPNPRKSPFTDEELEKLVPVLWEWYWSNPSYTVPLVILFLLYVPVRPDEAEALRFSDMDADHRLHVVRHQAPTFGSDGKLSELTVIPRVKSKARKKPVYVPEEARYILELAKEANKANGDDKEDYIFYNDHHLVTLAAINRCLDTACKKAGIPERCIYMERDTYASVLADDRDVPETLISDSMGHKDFKVDERHYIKGRTVKSAEAEVIENALNAKIPSHESVIPCNTSSDKEESPETR